MSGTETQTVEPTKNPSHLGTTSPPVEPKGGSNPGVGGTTKGSKGT